MKRAIVIAAALLLAGCAHTQLPDIGSAPPARMPDLPPTLAQPAHRLPPIADPSLGGINQAGADADSRYNDLALRFNALLGVYECVKKSLDDHKAANCF